MYRKASGSDGSYSSEDRYGYKSAPFRMTGRENSSGHFSSGDGRPSNSSDRSYSSKHLDREKDVYIRSRTFQNSNWRQPNQARKANSDAWEKASVHFDSSNYGLSKKDIAAVNSFMPHFCSKTKDANYTPSLSAVDKLTPKFVQMDLNNEAAQIVQGDRQQTGNHSALWVAPSSRHFQKDENQVGSWRNSSSSGHKDYSHANISYSMRRKFDHGFELTAQEIKVLTQPSSLVDMLGSKSSLYAVINDLDGKTAKVKMEDFEREELAREHLKVEMVSQYENCKVIPYGIRLLGMAHPKTAIYMFFDPGNLYYQGSNQNKEYQRKIRQSVYETMSSCGHCDNVRNWDVQELITFMHKGSDMNCVVSFLNGFKHQNTLLLRSYLSIDKRLRLLMLLVNDMVFRYHDLSKYFTSYVLNIMVIMYLQRIPDPVLPTLNQLRTSLPCENVEIGGFDCSFPHDVSTLSPSSNHLSTEKLLKGFCSFYKTFNWEEDIVSIVGGELKRTMFCAPYKISASVEPPISSYIQSLKTNEMTPKMNCDLPVIVQDPFELSCNAAEKMNLTVLQVFRMMCQDAYDVLSRWC